MVNREVIDRILTAGCQAPSGSNSQPWAFRILEDNSISVISFPEKDHPILNFSNRGTIIAIGALYENISIAANNFGYISRYEINLNNPKNILKITFEENNLTENQKSLYSAIFNRSTNRKKFKNTPLSQEFIGIVENFNNDYLFTRSRLLVNQKEIDLLAKASSINEIVMLENPTLHKLFFEEIIWDQEKEKKFKSGLFLKTMELGKPQELIFKLIKNRWLMNILNFFGFSRFIAKENSKIYSTCGAMGGIIVKNNDMAFFEAGRLMQKIWLFATSKNLGFQLLTGILFLNQRVEAEQDIFSKIHVDYIKKSATKINNIFSTNNSEFVSMIFRIGESDPPSARSSKKKPVIL